MKSRVIYLYVMEGRKLSLSLSLSLSKTLTLAFFNSTAMTVNPSDPPAEAAQKRWPGWPGDNVFRMIVPVTKVGSIIGKGGEIIKRLCSETGARIQILDGPLGTADRVVLISGKEEPETEVSPAMEAVLKVFKLINGVSSDGKTTSQLGIFSVRLLMASPQAIHLIGKQGSSIKSMQEESGAVIHVLTGDERAYYANTEERIVDIQGELLKVFKALEAVIGHLRKFLVDRSVIPLFEKNLNKPATEDRVPDAWGDYRQSLIHSPQQTMISSDYPLSLKRESLFLNRDAQHDSQVLHSRLSQDPALYGSRFSGPGNLASGVVTKVTQRMQLPLRYEKDIVGNGGGNIAYIRTKSGASVLVMDSGQFDEIAVEIAGTPKQVQTAQQLIEDFIAEHREPALGSYGSLETRSGPASLQLINTGYPSSSLSTHSYGGYEPHGSRDTRLGSAFSQLADIGYPSSYLGPETYGRYEPSGLGGYGNYRY